MSAEELAKGLTLTMREGLLNKPCRSWWGDVPACMPRHKSTAEALCQRGLCIQSTRSSSAFPLTPLGLQVQALLKDKADG